MTLFICCSKMKQDNELKKFQRYNLIMSLWFEALSNIDEITKFTVTGWIRKYEKQLKLPIVPNLIMATCILFYRMDEIFDIIDKNNIKLSADKKSITMNDETTHSNSYGLNEI